MGLGAILSTIISYPCVALPVTYFTMFNTLTAICCPCMTKGELLRLLLDVSIATSSGVLNPLLASQALTCRVETTAFNSGLPLPPAPWRMRKLLLSPPKPAIKLY